MSFEEVRLLQPCRTCSVSDVKMKRVILLIILKSWGFEEMGLTSGKTWKKFQYESRLWLAQSLISSLHHRRVSVNGTKHQKNIVVWWSPMENFYESICDGTFIFIRVVVTFLHAANSQRAVWLDEIKQKYWLRGFEILQRESCFGFFYCGRCKYWWLKHR